MSWIDTLLSLFAGQNDRQRFAVTRFPARLPSNMREAFFRVDLEVTWPSSQIPSVRIRAYAEERLREVACRVTAGFTPLSPGEACTAVNLALQRHLDLPEAGIRLVAAGAALIAEPSGVELAEHHEALSREVLLAQQTQQAKTERLRLLGTHVLNDPVLARLWWLDGNIQKLPQMVELDAVFEKTAARMGAEIAPGSDSPVPDLIRTFLDGLGPEHRQLLVTQLAHVFASYERPDLAQNLTSLQSAVTNGHADAPIHG